MNPPIKIILWRPRLLAATFAAFSLLFLLPCLITVALSLQQNSELDPFAGTFGLHIWFSFLGSNDLIALLMRSIGLACIVAAATSLLAVGPAYLAAVIGGKGRLAVLILCFTILLGDQVVLVMGWSDIGRQLVRWFIDPDASSGRYLIGNLMVALAEIHHALPMAILLQIWAMRRHDPALIEVGIECGASHGRLLRWVIAPVLLPGLVLGGLCSFAFSLGTALEPTLLNTGTMSLGERLHQALELDSNWPEGARLAILALCCILIVTGLTIAALPRIFAVNRHRYHDWDRRQQAYRIDRHDPLLPAIALGLGFLALPIIWVFFLSLRYFFGIFMTVGIGVFIRAMIEDPHLLPAIGISTLTALLSGVLASILGAGLVMLWRYLIARDGFSWQTWACILASALPFLLPSSLLSALHLAAHLFFTTYLPSGLGIIAVMLADAIRAMPLCAIAMLFFWQHLPRDIDETARDLTLDQQRLRRFILIPILQPGWTVSFLIAAWLSLGDFQLANTLSGDRVMLSPSLLAGIATQRSPIYFALSGPLLLLTVWACRVILTRLDRRDLKRAPQGNAAGFGLSLNIAARKN